MSKKLERRTVEIRVRPNEDGPLQDGLPRQFWARVLNYEMVDDYGTKFRYGSATESLQRRLPRLMYGHAGWENPAALLGRGIDFRDSKEGLDILFEFDDFDYVPMGRQIAHQMSNDPDNPTLDQFSIGFIRQRDTRDTDGKTVITKMRLGETSVVVEGSVPGTKLLAFRSSSEGPGQLPFSEGATMDANDAARIIARFSLGEVDLAQALDMVKSAVIVPEDEDETDETEEGKGGEQEEDTSDDDSSQDTESDDASGDEEAEDTTDDQADDSSEASSDEGEQEEDTESMSDEEAAAIEELLAEIDGDLADVEALARQPKVETRAATFQGNQHAGSKTDTSDVAGVTRAARLSDTPEEDYRKWNGKPAGTLVSAGAGAKPARVVTGRTKMWRDSKWEACLAFTAESGGKVVGQASSVGGAKRVAGKDIVWTDR